MKPIYSQATAANGWHGEWQEPVRRGWGTDEGMERYLKGLDAMETTPLQLALDAIGQFSDDLITTKCRALLHGYDARWRDAGYVAEKVEETLLADLYNPDSDGGKSRTFQLAGKLDVVAKHSTRRVLIDHKTCSQDITDPNAPYWRQLVVEGQVSHYMLLQWLLGEKCDDAVWDVVRKPMIAPKKLTKAEQKQVTSLGEYYGIKVSEASRQSLIHDERETNELYEIRLRHDCISERPEWYFQRRSIPRMDAEILEYARDVWQHSKDILYTRSIERLPPKNGGACMLYGSPCKFLGICSGHDEPESGKWQKKESVHPELPIVNNELELLTNSRIRCFQTCRRKHYYEYELGIERFDEEEKEALFFGTVYHAGLEAWWSFFKGT